MKVSRRAAVLLAALGLAQACHQPPPAITTTVPAANEVADFQVWWMINLEGVIRLYKPIVKDENLQDYGKKGPPPNPLSGLLALVGYQGPFCRDVKEIALPRIQAYPQVVEELTRILRDPKAPLAEREMAAYAAGDLKLQGLVKPLKETLWDKDYELRGFSARALGMIGDADGMKELLGVLENPKEDAGLRCLGIMSMADTEDPKARKLLADLAVKEEDWSVRRASIMALGVKPSKEDLKLLKALGEDAEGRVRSAAMIGIGLAGSDPGALRRHLKEDKDAFVRCMAALGLGIRPSPDFSDDLITAVEKDADLNAAGCACIALGRCGGPRASKVLSQAFQKHRHCFVKYYAALALGLTGDKDALPVLVEGLKHDSSFGPASSASAAIEMLGKAEGAETLLECLKNKRHAAIRQYSALALGHLRYEPGRKPVFDLLKDKASEVRRSAAVATGLFGDPATLPDLERLSKEDGEEAVRVCAALAVDVMTQDETKPLALVRLFQGDSRNRTIRKTDLMEINRALNRHLPERYKLAVSP